MGHVLVKRLRAVKAIAIAIPLRRAFSPCYTLIFGKALLSPIRQGIHLCVMNYSNRLEIVTFL